MLKNLVILFMVWGSVAVFAQDTISPVLPECAVLELQVTPADSIQGRSSSEALRQRIFQAAQVRLVARHQMDVILQEQGLQQSGCTGSECEVQTGRLLGVSQIITGSLVRTGTDRWDIRVSRLDVESGAVLGMGHWSTSGDLYTQLETGAKSLERQLWSKPDTTPASPSPWSLLSTAVSELSTPEESPATPDTTTLAEGNKWPLAFALIYPVQFPFKETAVHGLAIDALYGWHGAVHGLQVGSILRAQSLHGIAAGAVSLVDGSTAGIQVGAFYTRSQNLRGLQVGISNNAENVRGFQVGLVNTCTTLQGIQVGLVNQVTSRKGPGAWMPIVNVGF